MDIVSSGLTVSYCREEVESDESFGHRRSPPKRSLSSKALVAADEDEDKYQKAKLFSRKIGILLLFAGAATVLVLLYPGSGNGSETGNPEEQEQQNEFEHNAIFTERFPSPPWRNACLEIDMKTYLLVFEPTLCIFVRHVLVERA